MTAKILVYTPMAMYCSIIHKYLPVLFRGPTSAPPSEGFGTFVASAIGLEVAGAPSVLPEKFLEGIEAWSGIVAR